MAIILTVVIAVLCVMLPIILISSPGRLKPLKDGRGNVIPGSISEKVWIDAGGIRQGMFLRGENPQNPVILYLHGGPGMPLLQFIEYLEKQERLEKYFTVCYWDQRGSGMTYRKAADPSAMTVERMVEDTRAVTQYLQSRFGQRKIYLAGQSWGTYLGVKTAEKYPEHYLAYVGIGQITHQTESERLAHGHMLSRAREASETDIVEKLERYDPHAQDFPQLDYLVKVRTKLLNRYGIGHLHRGMTFGEMCKALFVFRGYTLGEKIKWVRGADFSMAHLFPVLLRDDLFQSSPAFELPVYIVQGAYDYQVSQVLAKRYLDAVQAPKKAYFAFAGSAHSPNMEEPEAFVAVFRKIAAENPPAAASRARRGSHASLC